MTEEIYNDMESLKKDINFAIAWWAGDYEAVDQKEEDYFLSLLEEFVFAPIDDCTNCGGERVIINDLCICL